jgi:SAM-dependent methyltransferase
MGNSETVSSERNKKAFDNNVGIFAHEDYLRPEEKELTKLFKSGKILIGGIGGGRTVSSLKKLGFEIVGLDISPKMVEACKTRFPDIDVRVGDIQRTDFADDTFDSVFLPFHTICYVDDIQETLKEMKRVLKPGGTICFSMVNRWFLRDILGGGAFRSKHVLTRFGEKHPDVMETTRGSMLDVYAFRKIFPDMRVWGKVSLWEIDRYNWKDRMYRLVPFVDKSLYFFGRKPDTL